MTYKIRAKFNKSGPARWLSHLDIAGNIERGFRRAKIPLAYSQGFSPHPKISFGPVLPVGISSRAEYFDTRLLMPLTADELKDRLNTKLPKVLQITQAVELADNSLSLGKLVKMCSYELTCSHESLSRNANFKLANDKLSLTNELITINSKNGKKQKIKIRNLNRTENNQRLMVEVVSEIFARPYDILNEIENLVGINFTEYVIERTEQYAIIGGELVDLASRRIVRSSSGSGR